MLIRLTHVCARWRKIIIDCPTFWTHIRFGGKQMLASLAELFFERAKGCALDVQVRSRLFRRGSSPMGQIVPTLPPGKWIRILTLEHGWAGIQKIFGMWADALSSLQALELSTEEPSLSSRSTIFVGDALKSLRLIGYAVPGLSYIRAPNLTAFMLSEDSQTPCSATRLFDFLEAAPTLEEVLVYADSVTVGDFPPPERTVTLPHVRRILFDMKHAPRLASYLNCPSLKDIQLVNMFPDDPTVGIFPPLLLWLMGRCSIETIDRVVMIVSDKEGHKNCSLEFRTPSGTAFQIACATAYVPEPLPPDSDEDWTPSVLFDQTVSALLSLPLDRAIGFSIDLEYTPLDPAADSVEVVAKLAGVLEKCTNLHEVVLQNYLPVCFPVFSRDKTPPIQVLVIKHSKDVLWEDLAEHVTEVARIRHSRGTPLTKIEIFTKEKHPRIEQLESWVQEVKYQVEPSQDNGSTALS